MSKTHPNGTSRVPQAKASAHPIFDALIQEARRSPRETDISHDVLGRQLGLTEEEHARAQAIIAEWEPDRPEDQPAEEPRDNDAAPTDGAEAARPARRDKSTSRQLTDAGA